MDSAPVGSRVLISLGAVYLIWGSTFLVIRIVVESMPPLLAASLRYLAAGAAVYAFARVRGAPRPSRREWLGSIPVGGLLFLLGNGLVCLAERHVSSGLAAVACAATPLFACALSAPFGEKHSRVEWIGVVLGFAGVVLLAIGDLRAAAASGALLLIAPFGWALGSVISRRIPLPVGTMAAATEMLMGGASTLAAALLYGERLPDIVPARALAGLAYLVVAGSIVGFSAYTYLLRHTTTALATSYAYVNPIIAVLLGARFGGERPGLGMIGPGALVVVGVLIVGLGRRPQPRMRV